MSGELAKLEAFIARWREPLEAVATVDFAMRMLDGAVAAPTQIADAFSVDNGFEPIGFNWELLDADAQPTEVRSALGAFKDAFSLDLVMKLKWLDDKDAFGMRSRVHRILQAGPADVPDQSHHPRRRKERNVESRYDAHLRLGLCGNG